MSDSDDTDILLLIPPDLFIVPSSDSDDSPRHHGPKDSTPGVVSEILDHVQSLENRISAIESREDSLEASLLNASSTTQSQLSSYRPAAPTVAADFSDRYSSCRLPSLPVSPVKSVRRSCVMSSPGSFRSLPHAADAKKYQPCLGQRISNFNVANRANADSRIWEKHDDSSFPKLPAGRTTFQATNFCSTEVPTSPVDLVENNSNDRLVDGTWKNEIVENKDNRESKDMELSEVDRLLRAMEFTEMELTKRINCSKSHCRSKDSRSNTVDHDCGCALLAQKNVCESKLQNENLNSGDGSDVTPVTDKGLSECDNNAEKETNRFQTASRCTALPAVIDDANKSGRKIPAIEFPKSTISGASFAEQPELRKSERFHTLLNFWDYDDTKSREEMLQIELEKEKFRREHCEHVIQELQKGLLEQQEMVAVAIRVDNDKKAIMSEFQKAWSQSKQRWESLESVNAKLVETMKNMTKKHDLEIMGYEERYKRVEDELSKALNQAAGYKKSSEILVEEKLTIIKNHADELEKYKLHIEQVNEKYDNLKLDYEKIAERDKRLSEMSNEELNKERMKSCQVRSEMAMIHKALDACESELTLLRQEKENLSLKIKEERARNTILEQNKDAIVEALNEAKSAEAAARDEAKALVNHQEQIRSQLRKVYQNQLDDLVKTKLQEFQQQLDAAELAFQINLETRQRAIAECAARKIKSIIDKHQLEINLLEEKHMEERRLCEIQLAQASEKMSMLESKLNMQCLTKIQLAEQLYSVMQKQWQQALQIISGGNMKNLSPLQRLNAEEFFQPKKLTHYKLICCNKDGGNQIPRPDFSSSSSQNLQSSDCRQDHDENPGTLTPNNESPLTNCTEPNGVLRKYIQMIFDMQQTNMERSNDSGNLSPPPVIREVPRKHYTKKNAIA